MFNCLVFVAVSTNAQATEDRLSLTNQLAECRRVIAARGWREVHEPLAVPGQSRTKLASLTEAEKKIPAIKQMLDVAESGRANLVVVYDISRWRVLAQQIELVLARCGCQMYSVSQPAMPVPPAEFARLGNDAATIVHGVGGVMSSLESAKLRRNFQVGMPGRVTEKGLPFHHWPHGYRKPEGRETDRQAIVVQIPEICLHLVKVKELYLAGASARECAAYLQKAGVPTPRGGKLWSVQSVLNILTNPFYAGLVHHGRHKTRTNARTGATVRSPGTQVTAAGKHEALWTEEEWRQLVERRQAVGGYQVGRTKHSHRFSRLLYVAGTDEKLWAETQRGRRVYYFAPESGAAYIGEVELCRQFGTALTALVDLVQTAEPPPDDSEAQLARVAAAEQKLIDARARYQRAYGDGVLGYDDFKARTQELDAQAQALTTERAALEDRSQHQARRGQRRDALLSLWQHYEAWMNKPDAEANAALAAIIDRIEIKHGKITQIVAR